MCSVGPLQAKHNNLQSMNTTQAPRGISTEASSPENTTPAAKRQRMEGEVIDMQDSDEEDSKEEQQHGIDDEEMLNEYQVLITWLDE